MSGSTAAIDQMPAVAGKPAAVRSRRGAFGGLLLLGLGLLFALWGQIYLMRQQYPLDGLLIYVAAVVLWYRAVRVLAEPAVAAPLLPSAVSLLRALPALAIGALSIGLFWQSGRNNNLALVLWLLAMAALVVAYWREGLTAQGGLALSRNEWLALGGILLLGLALRLYQLQSFPGTLYLDEGDAGATALRLMRTGTYQLYVPEITGHPSLFFYGLGFFMKLAGASILSMRLYTTIIGMLAILATYFLGRELLGPRGALIAAFLLAISHWHLTFSRVVFTTSLIPLFVALTMWLTLRALRTRQPLDFVWAGLAVGFGMQTYLPYRVMPVLIVAYLIYKQIGNRSFLRSQVLGLALMLVAFLISFGPLATHYVRQPADFSSRAQAASVSQDIERAGGSLAPLYDNIRKTIGMFNYRGDPRPRHNLPHAAMLDAISGIFLVLGFAYALIRWRKAEHVMLLTWLALTATATVLSLNDSNPHSSRSIGNLTAVMLLAALGVERTWAYARQNYGRLGNLRMNGLFAAAGVAALVLNANLFFNQQAKDRNVYYDFDPVQTMVAQEVARLGAANRVLVATAFSNHSAVKFLDDGVRYEVFNQALHLPVRDLDNRDLTFFLEPVQKQLLPLFQKYYPTAQIEDRRDRYGNPGFYEINVSRADAAAVAGVHAFYYRGSAPGTGEPALQRQEATIDMDWAGQAPLEPPFAALWQGTLFAARYGSYGITLQSTQPATVTLDGQVILKTEGGAPDTNLMLDGGFHSLNVEAVVTQKAGNLALRWRTPDAAETVVPSSALFALDLANNGLLGKYYRGNAWAGQPAIRQKDLFIFPNDLLPAPFSIEWEGQIYAPRAGQYTFGARSDDGSQLWIDEILAVDNGGHHADRYVEGRIQLTEGLHKLRLRYFQDDGGRAMELYWIPPGGGKEIVPSGALFPPGMTPSGPVVLEPGQPLVIVPAPGTVPGAPPAAPAPTAQPGVSPPPAPSGPLGSPGLMELAPVLTIGEDSGQGRLNRPRGVGVDGQGNIYVADTGNKRVAKFDAQGKFLAEWTKAADAFVEPIDVVVAPGGDIYVLEAEKDGAWRFSANGEFRGRVAEGLGLYRPRGMAVDSQGMLYFANTGGNSLVKAQPTGQMVGVLVGPGKANGQLQQPTGVAVGKPGNIYVADTYNQRVQLFAADGRFVSQWPLGPAGTVQGPHLAIGPDSTVFVTAPDSHQLLAFTREGKLLATWGGQGSSEGQFMTPVGVAVDDRGRVYIADSGNNRIQVWGGAP